MSIEDEALAKSVISLVHEVEVHDHDDGSRPSMVDFLLRRDDVPVGCAEVSRLTDEGGRRGENILTKEEIEAPGLRQTWDVTVSTRQIRRGVSTLAADVIARLEALAVTSLDVFLDDEGERAELAKARTDLAALGVSHCRVVGTKRGLVVCTSGGFSMSRGAQDVLDDLRDFLWFDAYDVPQKLLTHDGPERHAFIWVDWHAWGSWRALDGADLPTEPPDLPGGVTHLWVAPWTSWDHGEDQRGWLWDASDGWRAFSIPLTQIATD